MNAQNFHNGICFDKANGLYMVSKGIKGNRYPWHVQSKTSDLEQIIRCESIICSTAMAVASRSSDATGKCPHVISTQFLPSKDIEILDEKYLDDLVLKKKRINAGAKNEIMFMREKACSKGQVPVASWFPEGQNSVEFYLSVYTGKTESYCRLERVIILVNSKKDRMTCGCQWHQLRKGCVHKNLAKWYLNQYHSSRITTKVESEKIDLMSDVYDFDKLLETNNLSIDVDVESVKCMVNYIFMRRKVPVHIDDYILNIDNSETKEITPTEVECPECSGDLQTCKVELVTSNGIIVSHKYVIKDIKVYRMQCKCGLIIRHQDYTSNLWNFNDFLFLTVDFCIWLRNNLQYGVAVGTTIQVLMDTLQVNLPIHDVRCGYVLFECLTDYNNTTLSSTCVECSYYPTTLVWDTNQKVCFTINEVELKEYDGSSTLSETTDVDDFWDNVQKYCLYKAITCVDDSENPYYVKQSYTKWSPWIAPKTRKSKFVHNTEHEKVKIAKSSSDDVTDSNLRTDISEDMLVHLRNLGNKHDLQDLAESCDISVKGKTKHAIADLLEKHIKNGNPCNKLFEKFARRSGGITMGCCPHGIVYCMKWLLAYESPRDILDLLVSMKYVPTLTVTDIPRRVADHANARFGSKFFSPFNGMVPEPTEENLERAKSNDLKVNMTFMRNASFKQSTRIVKDHDYISSDEMHPITKVPEKIVLFDRLHERNSTQEEDRLLRSVKRVPELRGTINTMVVEQKIQFWGRIAIF